jgi:protein-disulfide isomerase
MSKRDTQKKSKRQLVKEQRQQKERRQRLFVIVAVVGVALILVAAVAVPAIQEATAPVGDFVEITPAEYPDEDGRALGDPNAPVTIEVFKDFQCSACKGYTEVIEPQVISELVEPGTVYYVFRQYPFMDDTSAVKDSDNAANASMCAAEQNRFWDYKAMLFANLNYVTGEFSNKRLIAFAESLGLEMGEFEQCLDQGRFQDEIDQDIDLGRQYGVTGTPSVHVNGVNIKPGYVPTFEEIKAAVEAAMQ